MRVSRYFYFFFLMSIGVASYSQTAGDYRSNVFITGNWATAGSWQRYNGAAWVAAGTAPTSADGVITILNGDQIVMNTARAIDQVVIASGGQLLLFDLFTPFVCTLANGPGTDIDVFGTLTISSNATLSGAGTIVNNSIGTFILNNQSTLAATATNNGTMQITAVANIANTTVTNNSTVNFDNTLNLNNATFINNGLFTLDGIFDSNITGTGGGVFTNDYGGTIFKTSTLGTGWIDQIAGAVSFSNRGLIKGFAAVQFRTTSANTGAIDPGDVSGSALTVNPLLITGKTPTFELQIASTGALAGITYDEVLISNLDATTVNISGTTLDLVDNASDAIGTVYTIVSSAVTINGVFAAVHLSPSLGNLTYNANTITVKKLGSQNRYTWNGGNGSWITPANWLPFRNAPAVNDILTFNNNTTVTVSNVPTETISALNVTNNATVNLQSSTTSKTLTIGNGYMNYMNIDPGSSLHVLNNAGVVLNPTIAPNSRVAVGGVLDMQNGTFNIGDNVLQLHTTAVPLTRTAGQFSIGSNGSIEFGDVLHVGGPNIVLGNNIFIAAPTIAKITMYRLNGASLGNQSITTNQAIFSLGDLTTNATGRIIFSTTATNPFETSASKIIGYADVAPRVVGTAAFNFLGVASPAGSTIGTASLTRVTGPAGINIFNGFASIASTWTMAVTTEPTPARSLTLSWLSDFDNGNNPALLMQDYRFDGGPGWTAVGVLTALQSAANPRITAPATTLKFTGSWTIGDQNRPLPIVLGEFMGELVSNEVILSWTTLSEINSDHFQIQRRTQSDEHFAIIGSIPAAGTSDRKLSYSFKDESPQVGINYYRLALVDVDGTSEYSKVVAVTYDENDFSIYPNPNNGSEFHVMLPGSSGGIVNIYDISQRKVASFSDTGGEKALSIKNLNLSTGVYIVIYQRGAVKVIKRMMVR